MGHHAHFFENGPGGKPNWENQQQNGHGEAGRTAATDKTLSPVTGDSGSEPISVLSRPVGKHSLRDLRSCPWQLSPSPELLPPGPVKAGHGVRRSKKHTLQRHCSSTEERKRCRSRAQWRTALQCARMRWVESCSDQYQLQLVHAGSNSRGRDPRELEPGVLCAKAFRFRMQRDAWNGSTPAMDHMMVSISPCHCPSVLSRHVPTSDCPGILGRRTRPRAVAVNASSKACVCTSTTLV